MTVPVHGGAGKAPARGRYDVEVLLALAEEDEASAPDEPLEPPSDERLVLSDDPVDEPLVLSDDPVDEPLVLFGFEAPLRLSVL